MIQHGKKDFPRHVRVGDQIQRELATIIPRELKTAKIPSLLTITSVEASRDLGVARVYLSSLDDTIDRQVLIDELSRHTGQIRKFLGARMRIRAVPQLRFIYDDTTEQAMRLNQKIDQAIAHSKSDAE